MGLAVIIGFFWVFCWFGFWLSLGFFSVDISNEDVAS